MLNPTWGGHAFDLCGGINTLRFRLDGLQHAHDQTKAMHGGKNTHRQQLVWAGWELWDHPHPPPSLGTCKLLMLNMQKGREHDESVDVQAHTDTVQDHVAIVSPSPQHEVERAGAVPLANKINARPKGNWAESKSNSKKSWRNGKE